MNLDDLENEYMALAEAGNVKAIGFAVVESDEFCMTQEVATMALLRSREGQGPLTDVLREMLMKSLEEHVAPIWARVEYAQRREENLEMQREWQESEFREITRGES